MLKKLWQNKKLINIVYFGIIMVLVLFTLWRCFDNALWGDEAFSACLVRTSFFDVLWGTARDVHPPLYYLLVKGLIKVFGESGFILHFASFLPYFAIIVIACTWMRKKYGRVSSLLFCALTTITPVFAVYNVEIRMYSLGALLIFAAFLLAVECFKKGNYKQYLLLSLLVALAAYSHYYCIVMGVMIYAVLLVANIIKKKNIAKVIVSGFAAVVLYAPWLLVLYRTFGRVSNNWWSVSTPGVDASVIYPFANNPALTVVMVCYIFLALFYCSKILVRRGRLKYSIDLTKFNLNEESVSFILGLVVYMGTVAVGVIVSHVIRPLFLLRYLVPAVTVIYFLIAISVNKFKFKYAHSVVIVLLVLALMLPTTIATCKKDYINEQKTKYTLPLIEERIKPDTIVLTDIDTFNWRVISYYFPEVEHAMIKEAKLLDISDAQRDYMIMWSKDLSEDTKNSLKERGFVIEEFVNKEQGALGVTGFVGYILRVDSKK